MNYEDFLARKSPADTSSGLKTIPELGPNLKPFQRVITEWALKRGRAAIFEDTGLGKAQPAGTSVLTPSGWKLFNDIRVGDYVVGSSGYPTIVNGVYPQGYRDTYRISFSDGCSVLCDIEHLWNVQNKTQKYRKQGYKTLSTKQIMENSLTEQEGWRNFIPIVNTVQFFPHKLPIDPYLLGVLIGDGSLTSGSPMISSADDEILEEISKLLPDKLSLKWSSQYDWRISGESKNNQWTPNELTVSLRELKLWGTKSETKFIPDDYKFSSVSDREAILQGILDTDGHVRADNNIEYCTVSEQLAKDVQFIIQSLGGLARIRTKKTTGQLAYRMSVQLPYGIKPFRLNRKSNVYKDREKYQPTRAIVSIENTNVKDFMICISVEAEDQLYVTTGCVVTHNTLQQLEWARAVTNYTQGRTLILTPLAVAEQTVQEAVKFGIEGVSYASSSNLANDDITITNYDRLHRFDTDEFVAIVLDESSIIKSHDSKTRIALIEAFKNTPYKLCLSATPAPNDYTELGNHAEFLNVMSEKEMLSMFFVHDGSVRAKADGNGEWRLKRHAQKDFWKWLASWSVVIRSPEDLGFDEPGYRLPPLHHHQITVQAEYKPTAGFLFPMEARTMSERISVRRESIDARITAAADIVRRQPDEPWLIWCNLNAEADAITEALENIGAVQVAGRHDNDYKKRNLLGFTKGTPRILVSKVRIAGFGMNFQHCSNMLFLGLNDSFEQLYQAKRRSWRFGQTRPVNVYMIASELEGAVVANLERKEHDHERMMSAMAEHMRELTRSEVLGGRRATSSYNPSLNMEIPAWL